MTVLYSFYFRARRRQPLLLIFLPLCAWLAGCQTLPGAHEERHAAPRLHDSVQILHPERATRYLDEAQARELLYQQHDTWRGTPYRLGGLSQSGIDCSGFVQMTFKDIFGIQLPRMSTGQTGVGQRISEKELRSGDLVFFRNGSRRHVGIYLEGRRFLHVSSRNGVMISSLDNVYWSREYWRAVSLRS